MATKPTDGHMDWITDDDTAKYIAPSSGKRLQGWIQQEKPPFQYFNWAFRLMDRWLKYFEQQTDEIAAAVITRVGANEAVAGVAQVTFTGLEAGGRYKMEFELDWDSPPSSNFIQLRFGGSSGMDAGTNYTYRRDHFYGTASYFSGTEDAVPLVLGFDYLASTHIGAIEFAVPAAAPTKAHGLWRVSSSQSHYWDAGMFEYQGAESVDRVQLLTGSLANNFSGAVRLFKTN